MSIGRVRIKKYQKNNFKIRTKLSKILFITFSKFQFTNKEKQR